MERFPILFSLGAAGENHIANDIARGLGWLASEYNNQGFLSAYVTAGSGQSSAVAKATPAPIVL